MPKADQYTESSRLERGESEAAGSNYNGYGSTAADDNLEKESFNTAASSSVTYNKEGTGSDCYDIGSGNDDDNKNSSFRRHRAMRRFLDALTKIPLRRVAMDVSLYVNLFITLAKFVAYIQTLSLSVLAALLDSVLDVVSQFVLNYTEKHSSLQRSSAFYPAGASRLEPIGVLTCAALMGMGSFEVLKESVVALVTLDNPFTDSDGNEKDSVSMASFWSMSAIVIIKLLLLLLCQRAAEAGGATLGSSDNNNLDDSQSHMLLDSTAGSSKAAVQLADPTLEALAQDHWNDALSNTVAACALLAALQSERLWFLDPIGAIIISIYIIWSWYHTGKEQIEQLTGKSAPEEFIEELLEIANTFDESGRMIVDVCRAYHFGPKFLVELEVVLPKNTLLFESHDLGMELQYEIESREEVERCFVHIDYEQRPYDEHVVSKVPELREKYRPGKEGLRCRSTHSL